MYLNVVDSCSIMANDYELTMHYDMTVSLGNNWFQIDRYDCLEIWNMWLTYVSMMQGVAWQETLPLNIEEGLGWAFPRNHGDWVMVFVVSLVILVFYELLILIWGFVYV